LTSKEAYIHFFAKHSHLFTVFVQPAWLDIVCAKWEVFEYNTPDGVLFIPYQVEKKIGFTLIRNPILSPYTCGPICLPMANAHRPQAMNSFYNELPRTAHVYVDTPLALHNSLRDSSIPFDLVHTNTLTLHSDLQRMYALLKPTVQRQLKKGQKRLLILPCNTFENAINLLQLPYVTRGNIYPYKTGVLQKLWQYCKDKNCGIIWLAFDTMTDAAVGALWQVWDCDTSYYLTGGTNLHYSDASSTLMWHAIQHANTIGSKTWDFEGSSIPSIDAFFKNFGGQVQTYARLHRPNKWFALLSQLKR
jgi:hypothetical protein